MELIDVRTGREFAGQLAAFFNGFASPAARPAPPKPPPRSGSSPPSREEEVLLKLKDWPRCSRDLAEI